MASIVTREPIETGMGPLDELVRGFFVRPVSLESRGSERPAQFRMDVTETEDAYRVLADLPGVQKQDINVTIEENQVAISAEVGPTRSADGKEKRLLTERVSGKYYRGFALGHKIDQARAEARYVDGVLELTLPKSPDSMPRKISVH